MIIFLYGPDTFRSKQKLKSLKDKFTREVDKSGLNLVEIEAQKISISDISRAILSQSFLADKRMVVIRNVFKQKKAFQTEILELLKKGQFRNGKDENVLIFWDEKADKNSALFKYLAAGKFKEEFNVLNNHDLVKWVEERVKQKHAKISHQEAVFLASKSDGDLWALAAEIDKLVAYCRGRQIARDDIAESWLVKLDDNIFNLTDAVANRDKKLALKLVDEQLEAGIGELYLLSMIVRQFRILIQVKAVMEDSGEMNSRSFARQLGLHPFVVKKAMPQAAKYTRQELKKIYHMLFDIDLRIKTSDVKAKTLLEVFVVEISNL